MSCGSLQYPECSEKVVLNWCVSPRSQQPFFSWFLDGVLCLRVLECQVALLELALTSFWTAGAGELDGG